MGNEIIKALFKGSSTLIAENPQLVTKMGCYQYCCNHSEEKLESKTIKVIPDEDEEECDFGCGFKGTYREVYKHEVRYHK